MKDGAHLMAELRCLCGTRRLIRTIVLSDVDGNPWEGPWDEILKCAGCGRGWRLEADGDGPNVKLRLAVGHESIPAWRPL